MHGLEPGVSLAELGSLSVFVDHVSEESMTPVGISPGAGARDDRAGVILATRTAARGRPHRAGLRYGGSGGGLLEVEESLLSRRSHSAIRAA